MAGRHKGDTKEFRELTFAEQAKSIMASVNDLQAAIEHHIARSPRQQETIEECLAQVDRLRRRLRATDSQQGTQPVPGGVVPGVVSGFHVRSPRLAQPERAAGFTKEVIEERSGPARPTVRLTGR